jgi:hypothetical protein
MTNLDDKILTNEKFNTLGNYLDGTDFNGVEYNKNETLLEYGFLYDSRTGDMIVTLPNYVWEEKDSPIKFGVTNVSKDKIDEVFDNDSTRILSENKLTLPKWDVLCDEYKINMIENTTMGLDLSKVELNMSVDDLIEYLKKKI